MGGNVIYMKEGCNGEMCFVWGRVRLDQICLQGLQGLHSWGILNWFGAAPGSGGRLVANWWWGEMGKMEWYGLEIGKYRVLVGVSRTAAEDEMTGDKPRSQNCEERTSLCASEQEKGKLRISLWNVCFASVNILEAWGSVENSEWWMEKYQFPASNIRWYRLIAMKQKT